MSIFEAVLPKEWLWACVGDFYAVTKKPRSLNLSAFEKIPFSPMDCIPQGGQFDLRYTYKAAEEIKSGTYFEHGDVLVGKITPCFENGKQALAVNFSAPFGYATTEVIPLHPKDKNQDRRVLFYYLLHPDVRSHITEKMEGATGRQRVPENVLLELAFPRIPFTEQEKIGIILLTVQQAIQCEAVGFEKAQELKRAAMREVFTRGLRGEAQKQTEIGLVPESWSLRTVAKAVRPFKFERGKQLPTTAYQSTGKYPIIDQGQSDIAGYTDSDDCVIKPDIPLVIFGDHTRSLKYADFPFALGADGTKPLVASDGLNPKFLFYALANLDIPSRGYNRHYKILAEKIIAFPSIQEEQSQIVTLLSAIDDKITLHKRKKAALEALFTSLLHQLMTGKIRVGDLDLSSLNAPQTEAA
jgi:type I restriction enzyme S subunit